MKKTVLLLSLIISVNIYGNAQLRNATTTTITKTDDAGTVTITKVYDEDGVLTRYDSIYHPKDSHSLSDGSIPLLDSIGNLGFQMERTFDSLLKNFIHDSLYIKFRNQSEAFFKKLPNLDEFRSSSKSMMDHFLNKQKFNRPTQPRNRKMNEINIIDG